MRELRGPWRSRTILAVSFTVTSPAPDGPSPRALGTLFLIALAVRAAFVFLEPSTRLVADERVWVAIGRQVASPEVAFAPLRYPQIFHPPLYAYMVGLLEHLTGSLDAVKWVQVVLGALLVPLVVRVGSTAWSPRVGLLAGWATALYPELIWYTGHFWSEVLFLALLWGAIGRLVASERAAAMVPAGVAGLLCGLAALVRETALVAAPAAGLWLVLGRRQGGRRAAVFLGACLVTVLPWTLRNWQATGELVPVATRASFNLWLGNSTEPWDDIYREYHGTPGGAVAQSRHALDEAVRAVWERQPTWILEKLARELPAFFGVNDHAVIHVQRGAYAIPGPARWLVLAAAALPLLLVMALALPGFLPASRERYGSLLVGFACLYLALHVVAFASTRFRLPVLPVLFLLAARTVDLGIARSWRDLSRTQRAATVVVGATLALSVGANLVQTVRHPVFRPAPTNHEAHTAGPFPPSRTGRRQPGFAPPCACARMPATSAAASGASPGTRSDIWSQCARGARSTWARRSPSRIPGSPTGSARSAWSGRRSAHHRCSSSALTGPPRFPC